MATSPQSKRSWTATEDRQFRRLYPQTPTSKLADLFRRKIGQVYAHARFLGLSKNPQYLAAKRRAEAARLSASGAAHRFPPGHVPANKGLRRPGWAAGRMRETQFKKGMRMGAANNNWKPVGTVCANSDGYLRRKIADQPESIAGKGANSTNWEFVHKRVWEDAHGPIPKGYRIWWKDGNHSNCALDNLELLSGAEHMARTTVHTLPKELAEVIQLKGALQRQINKRSKENAQKQALGSAQPSL